MSYKDIATKTAPVKNSGNDSNIETNHVYKSRNGRERKYRRHFLKELLIDNNLDDLIDLHEIMEERFNMFGFLNNSKSSNFIHMLMDIVAINNASRYNSSNVVSNINDNINYRNTDNIVNLHNTIEDNTHNILESDGES